MKGACCDAVCPRLRHLCAAQAEAKAAVAEAVANGDPALVAAVRSAELLVSLSLTAEGDTVTVDLICLKE